MSERAREAPERRRRAGRSAVRRRRLVAALIAIGLLGAALLAVRVAGGPPEDELARLVPADALVYLRASTDPDRGADAALLRRLERFPGLRRWRERALRAVGGEGGALSLRRDVRPWLGDEAALAFVPVAGSARTETLILAAVEDAERARAFIGRGGARRAVRHRGVDVLSFGSTSAAVAQDVLVVGSARLVRAAIDRREVDGDGLARSAAFRSAAPEEPLDDRVLDLYASAAGARTVLAPRVGVLREALTAPVRAQLAPDPDGLRARIRFTGARRPGFRPRLLGAAPRDAAGVLALGGLEPLVARLVAALPQAVAAARSAGVDLERDLLAPFRGQEVVAWVLGTSATTPATAVPSVAILGRTRDPARTREALGRLQGPLVQALAPGDAEEGGQAPLFDQRTVAGVPAFVLSLAPGVELVYAVIGSDVVLATSADAVARVRRAGAGAASRFGRKGIGVPETGAKAITSLDPGQLLALGDQLGIIAGSSVQRLREDLALVPAITAAARREETDTTAELLFQIP